MRRKARRILATSSHLLSNQSEFLKSGRRYRVPVAKSVLKKSFIPNAIGGLNSAKWPMLHCSVSCLSVYYILPYDFLLLLCKVCCFLSSVLVGWRQFYTQTRQQYSILFCWDPSCCNSLFSQESWGGSSRGSRSYIHTSFGIVCTFLRFERAVDTCLTDTCMIHVFTYDIHLSKLLTDLAALWGATDIATPQNQKSK